METEGVSLLQSGVWLIPVFLAATLAIVFLIVRRWREQSLADIKRLRSDLRQLSSNHRDILLAMQGHSPGDPEPYGSRAAVLQTQINEIGARVRQLEEQHVAIQEQAHVLKQNSFQSLVGGPYFWFQLRQEIQGAWADMEGTWQSLGTAAELAQQLDRLGWEVAQNARQVSQIEKEADEIMEALRARGIHGKAIEAATHQEKQAKSALAQVPVFFMDGDEEAVLQQADKDSTTATHGLLENARQALQNLVVQARSWDKEYAQAAGQVTAMQRSLVTLEATLTRAPSELNIAQRRAQLGQLKSNAQHLSDQIAQLDIEQSGAVAQEAEQVARAAREAENELKQAYESVARLEKELLELSGGLKQISMIIAALSAKTNYPVVWGQSSDRLTDLNRQTAAIGPAKKPREPAQANQDLGRAARLNEQQRELAQRVQQCEAQHNELVQITNSPEISQINLWLENAQQLAAKVKEYAPENWPRIDAVGELPVELQAMANDVLRVMPPASRSTAPQTQPAGQPPRSTPPVAEAELPSRLEDARRLAAAYQKLQKRVDNIRNQLANIQKEEKQTQDQLTSAQATVSQINLLVRSNPFLSELAAQDVGRFQRELQDLLVDLGHRQRGGLDKKVKQGSALLGKIEQSANRWLDQLNQDIHTQVQGLTKTLNALEGIAIVEEQPVQDARRLLASGQAFGANYTGKAKFRLDELTPEFKRRSDFWQSCAGASKGMEEVIQPLIQSYQEADFNRQQAHEMLSQVAAWLRQAQDWPPHSASLEAERHEIDRVDGQWQALKSNQTRAIQLVQQLGQFAARYHDLAVKIQQTSEHAEQEMTAVEELENQLIDLEQRWQNNWNNYQSDPDIVQEIRRLLDETDRELANLKRAYKNKSKNYSQVLQSLKSLERKVAYYQVALDENRALDVDGNEKRKR